MNFNKGILSIRDPKGRYMGMQNVASAYLTGRCIHITYQGPETDPAAVVVEVCAEEDRRVKEEDKVYTRIKADYKKWATPQMFSLLVRGATVSFDVDKKYNKGNTYWILDNNGRKANVTPEEFYDELCDISALNFRDRY